MPRFSRTPTTIRIARTATGTWPNTKPCSRHRAGSAVISSTPTSQAHSAHCRTSWPVLGRQAHPRLRPSPFERDEITPVEPLPTPTGRAVDRRHNTGNRNSRSSRTLRRSHANGGSTSRLPGAPTTPDRERPHRDGPGTTPMTESRAAFLRTPRRPRKTVGHAYAGGGQGRHARPPAAYSASLQNSKDMATGSHTCPADRHGFGGFPKPPPPLPIARQGVVDHDHCTAQVLPGRLRTGSGPLRQEPVPEAARIPPAARHGLALQRDPAERRLRDRPRRPTQRRARHDRARKPTVGRRVFDRPPG